MRNSKSINLLSVCVIAAAAVVLGVSFWVVPPKVASGLHGDVGRALAREAVKLGAAGKEVTLIMRDTAAFPQPSMDLAAAAFEKECSRSGIKQVTRHTVQLDPLKPTEVPPGDFFEILRKATAQQVIVSLLGPPVLTQDQFKKLKGVKAKVIAFCPGTSGSRVDLQALFNAGLLHAAFVERNSPRTASKTGESPAFDQLYTFVESGRLTALSALK